MHDHSRGRRQTVGQADLGRPGVGAACAVEVDYRRLDERGTGRKQEEIGTLYTLVM